MKLPENPSESFKRRNPTLYLLGSLPDPKREPHQRSQGEDRQLDKSREGVAYCITVISLRRKLVDAHDNLRSGAKPLVDQITRSLGFASDDNPRLSWQYGQLRTEGEQGTLVVIELTEPRR